MKRHCLDLPQCGHCRPFTGAWIETTQQMPMTGDRLSPLHGGVD